MLWIWRLYMPNMNGMGPYGAGPGFGRGFGRGMGHGRGSGRGCGPGRGWIAVGYASGGNEAVSAHMRVALEVRKAFLREELARTEALLEGSPEKKPDSGNQAK
jgi:hypothetical protein